MTDDMTENNMQFLSKMLEVQETANAALESIERFRQIHYMQPHDGWLSALHDIILTQQTIINSLAEENTQIMNAIQERLEEVEKICETCGRQKEKVAVGNGIKLLCVPCMKKNSQ